MPRDAPASAEVARRMTLRQGLLAALLALAMMGAMSAGSGCGGISRYADAVARGLSAIRAVEGRPR